MKHALLFVLLLAACTRPRPQRSSQVHDVIVAPGESIQAAIDASPAGTVVSLQAGCYPERIVIQKPLTIIGAGWDQTIIGPQEPAVPLVPPTDDDEPRSRRLPIGPTITVHRAGDVNLRGIQVRGPNMPYQSGLTEEALIVLDEARVSMTDCATLGPFMNGIAILDGSDVRIERCLVAAFWGVGVAVRASKTPGQVRPARVSLAESDVRNCYHRCVTIASSDVVVERCRISGSAWHGIRYDGRAPTIRGNQIFGHARCGIYASGDTAALVTENVFWRNEMDGISCWYRNNDRIEGNTFVGNLREGVAVLGGARPTVSRNLFVRNPIGIFAATIGGDETRAVGNPDVADNLFSSNDLDFKISDDAAPLPPGNDTGDPGFVDEGANNFALTPGSLSRQRLIGAADPLPLSSPFPIQPEERAIIPESDTRDWRAWKK